MDAEKLSQMPLGLATPVALQISAGGTVFNNNNSYTQRNSNILEPTDMQSGQTESGPKRKKGIINYNLQY